MSARRKILITGASGMLGRVLCARLSAQNEIIAVSKTGRSATIACELSNQSETAAFFEARKPDFVINTAAYSDVDGCERDPKLAHDSNALSVKHLAALCGRFGVPLIHVSTDYVFDGLKKTPYTETDPVNPVNIYGLTKLEGEYYAAHCKSPAAIVRTSWLFGPDNPANFVNAIVGRMKKEGAVSVLSDQMDAPTSVTDLSAALEKIIERLLRVNGKMMTGEIYHVCNAGSATRYDMALKIKEILGLEKVTVSRTDSKMIQGRLAVRPPYAVMSCRRFEEAFATKLRPWEESLKEFLLK